MYEELYKRSVLTRKERGFSQNEIAKKSSIYSETFGTAYAHSKLPNSYLRFENSSFPKLSIRNDFCDNDLLEESTQFQTDRTSQSNSRLSSSFRGFERSASNVLNICPGGLHNILSTQAAEADRRRNESIQDPVRVFLDKLRANHPIRSAGLQNTQTSMHQTAKRLQSLCPRLQNRSSGPKFISKMPNSRTLLQSSKTNAYNGCLNKPRHFATEIDCSHQLTDNCSQHIIKKEYDIAFKTEESKINAKGNMIRFHHQIFHESTPSEQCKTHLFADEAVTALSRDVCESTPICVVSSKSINIGKEKPSIICNLSTKSEVVSTLIATVSKDSGIQETDDSSSSQNYRSDKATYSIQNTPLACTEHDAKISNEAAIEISFNETIFDDEPNDLPSSKFIDTHSTSDETIAPDVDSGNATDLEDVADDDDEAEQALATRDAREHFYLVTDADMSLLSDDNDDSENVATNDLVVCPPHSTGSSRSSRTTVAATEIGAPIRATPSYSSMGFAPSAAARGMHLRHLAENRRTPSAPIKHLVLSPRNEQLVSALIPKESEQIYDAGGAASEISSVKAEQLIAEVHPGNIYQHLNGTESKKNRPLLLKSSASPSQLSRKSAVAKLTASVTAGDVDAPSTQLHALKKDVLRTARKMKDNASGLPKTHPALFSSLFPNVPPTIRFFDENSKVESLPWEFRKSLIWRTSLMTPTIVRNILMRSSFRASKLTTVTEDLDSVESSDWIYYFGKHMRPGVFLTIRSYQKVNHLPCSFQLGRKDRLWRNLLAMQQKHGPDHFNFFPQTFCLPGDMTKLKEVWDSETLPHQWILKPPASARGIGIRLVSKWSSVPKKRPYIVQKYLHDPFLINESKFDLRIYVFVYSVKPLFVFVHEEGLVRFASQTYSNSPRFVGNRFVHLTNYSVNRLNVEYVSNNGEDGYRGHKWSLRALWAFLRSKGVDPVPVWENIKDIVVKTCIATEAQLKMAIDTYCHSPFSVQELFGFDIFLDSRLKPWILEVNVSPSMHSDSPLDVKVKGSMIRDMLNLTGIYLPETKEVGNAIVRSVVESKTTHVSKPASIQAFSSELANSLADAEKTIEVNEPPKIDLVEDNIFGQIIAAPIKSATARPLSTHTVNASVVPKKPKPPAHYWLADKRLTEIPLSEDERQKHKYYVMRAHEAGLSYSAQRGTRAPISRFKISSSPVSVAQRKSDDVISSQIFQQHEPKNSQTSSYSGANDVNPLQQFSDSASARSQGIGPDSPQLEELIQSRMTHQKMMEERQLRKKMLQRGFNNNGQPEADASVDMESKSNLDCPTVKKQPTNNSEAGNSIALLTLEERFEWATNEILGCITPYDLRCLIHALDLQNRTGGFQCAFPTANAFMSAQYLSYFEKARYANLLLAAFFHRFGFSSSGIKFVFELAETGLHLKSGKFDQDLNPAHVWKPSGNG